MVQQTVHVIAAGLPTVELIVRAEIFDGFGVRFDRTSFSRDDREDLLVRLRVPAKTRPGPYTVRFEGEDVPGWTGEWIYAGDSRASEPSADANALYLALLPRHRLPATETVATLDCGSHVGRFAVRPPRRSQTPERHSMLSG